jgi:hypothetical protein
MADAQGQTDSNTEYPQDGKTPKHETLKGIRGGDKHQARSASQPSDRAPGRPRFKIRSSLLSFRVCMPKVPWQLRHYIILFCRNVEIFKKYFFLKEQKKIQENQEYFEIYKNILSFEMEFSKLI